MNQFSHRDGNDKTKSQRPEQVRSDICSTYPNLVGEAPMQIFFLLLLQYLGKVACPPNFTRDERIVDKRGQTIEDDLQGQGKENESAKLKRAQELIIQHRRHPSCRGSTSWAIAMTRRFDVGLWKVGDQYVHDKVRNHETENGSWPHHRESQN